MPGAIRPSLPGRDGTAADSLPTGRLVAALPATMSPKAAP